MADDRANRAEPAVSGVGVGTVATGDESCELRRDSKPGEPDHEGRDRDVVQGDELGEIPGRIEPEALATLERADEQERPEKSGREDPYSHPGRP
jgi:hypothetical protein